jgi:hypothetical protein
MFRRTPADSRAERLSRDTNGPGKGSPSRSLGTRYAKNERCSESQMHLSTTRAADPSATNNFPIVDIPVAHEFGRRWWRGLQSWVNRLMSAGLLVAN